jgi:hypothetical protein
VQRVAGERLGVEAHALRGFLDGERHHAVGDGLVPMVLLWM